MLRKLFLSTALIAFIATPISAQERTFVTNPPTTSGTGVTYNSGTNTVTATAADGTRLYSVTRPIERNAKYTYEFTVSNYSVGSVAPYIGTIRDNYTAPTVAATVTAAQNPLNPGLTPIASNFTLNDGLNLGQPIPTEQTLPDPGAFRFFCGAGQLRSDDPLIMPNMPGASHLHQFFGNTGANAYSTYKTLRRSGGSTCGSDQAHPINRSAYWSPAMLNGRGGVVTPASINVYYKRSAASKPECTTGNSLQMGICVRIPRGLGMIWGFNMTTMTAAPTGAVGWACRAKTSRPPGADGGDPGSVLRGASIGGNSFSSLKALREAPGSCPIGAAVHLTTNAPPCWNGTQVQTPNHRAHMAYRVENKCPTSHPHWYMDITLQMQFDVDTNLNTWRLSSDDQMGMGVDAGSTFHTDYMEAWDPTYVTQFYNGCIDSNFSCSGGVNGLGQGIKGGNDRHMENSRVVPLTRQGLGLLRNKNGTFRGEFTAPADGEFGLNFLLFTGNITGFKVTKITTGAGGPVTQPVTQ